MYSYMTFQIGKDYITIFLTGGKYKGFSFGEEVPSKLKRVTAPLD